MWTVNRKRVLCMRAAPRTTAEQKWQSVAGVQGTARGLVGGKLCGQQGEWIHSWLSFKGYFSVTSINVTSTVKVTALVKAGEAVSLDVWNKVYWGPQRSRTNRNTDTDTDTCDIILRDKGEGSFKNWLVQSCVHRTSLESARQPTAPMRMMLWSRGHGPSSPGNLSIWSSGFQLTDEAAHIVKHNLHLKSIKAKDISHICRLSELGLFL